MRPPATADDLVTVPSEVARVAAEFGSRAFFGLSGSGNFHLTHELRDIGLAYYAATHEAGCVAMADGYARTSGKIGIATVHQGPGLTNSVTALREAVRSHTPLIVLAADVPSSDGHHNQYVDQRAIATSAGAAVETITDAETTVDVVCRSFHRALTSRRPVVLLIRIDVQERVIPRRPLDTRAFVLPSAPAAPANALDEAASILRGARRPVILAGRGATAPGAAQAIIELSDEMEAPLLTSTQANGLFHGNPRYLGTAGGFGTHEARRVLAGADAVLVLGCSLNSWTLTGNELLSTHAQIIQVDIAPPPAPRGITVRLPIVGDAASVASDLRNRLRHEGRTSGGANWNDELPAQPRPMTASAHPDRKHSSVVDPYQLTELLDDVIPDERTVSIDSGHFMIFPASMLRSPDPAGFLLAQAFMSMGLALAEGIGAAVARPDRLGVVCLGDGGAKMSLLELDTAVRHRIPLLVVIFNDAAYGAEVHDFADAGRPLDIVRFRDIDFAAVARGIGAEAATVRSMSDLEVLTSWLERRNCPLVIDAKVDPTIRGNWVD